MRTDDVIDAMERCAGDIVRTLDQIPTFADDLAAAFEKDGSAGLRRLLKERTREVHAALAESMRLIASEDNERSARTPDTTSPEPGTAGKPKGENHQ